MDLRRPTARLPRTEDFSSPLHSPAVTGRIGVWLGICFGLAFVTGVISHYAQDTPSWLSFPLRPVSLYRVTQGVHVASGAAAIPLLLVKLWSVYPRLFLRPGRGIRELAVHGLERASIGLLVAASIFELGTGLLNTTQWYPWLFHFRATHYAVGWVAIGALLVHIAIKLPVIRSALGVPIESPVCESAAEPAGSASLSRRGLVRTALLSSGVVQTKWLSRLEVIG